MTPLTATVGSVSGVQGIGVGVGVSIGRQTEIRAGDDRSVGSGRGTNKIFCFTLSSKQKVREKLSW
jgi:hypothetical protein